MRVEYVPVSDFGTVITGKTPSTSKSEYWNGSIPFITPTDINGYDMFRIYKTERYISNVGADSQIKTVLPKESVCVTCIGSTIGKVCLTSGYAITNQQINSIVVNNNYSPLYVYYVLRNNLKYIQMISGGTGSGTPIISKNKFEKIKYPVHIEIEMQNRIADILSKYDELIEVNNQRIKKLEQTAEELYKEWFVRFRFPNWQNTEFENGIPKGWEYKSLFEIGKVDYGYAFSSNLFCDDNTLNPVVRIRDIQDNKTNTFTPEICDDKYLISENSILVGMDGIFHMCLWNGSKAFLNQRVVMINSIYANYCNYLLYLSLYPQVKFWEAVIAGTTVAHLGDKHLKKMKILIPNDEFLKEYNPIFESLMVQKNRLMKQNDNLIKQRDYLLPRLMSGKLEV